jgi:hypothetical protein
MTGPDELDGDYAGEFFGGYERESDRDVDRAIKETEEEEPWEPDPKGDTCNLRRHSEHRFCCGGCHRAFSSMAAFDWHRRGHECTNPAAGDFVPRVLAGMDGPVTVWGGPGSDREWWAAS